MKISKPAIHTSFQFVGKKRTQNHVLGRGFLTYILYFYILCNNPIKTLPMFHFSCVALYQLVLPMPYHVLP